MKMDELGAFYTRCQQQGAKQTFLDELQYWIDQAGDMP